MTHRLWSARTVLVATTVAAAVPTPTTVAAAAAVDFRPAGARAGGAAGAALHFAYTCGGRGSARVRPKRPHGLSLVVVRRFGFGFIGHLAVMSCAVIVRFFFFGCASSGVEVAT